MTPNRKLLGAAAFSLALAGGGVAGALLGTPSLSRAQHETDQSTEAADAPGERLGHHGEDLGTAAEALGMTEEALRSALQDGKSIAQVAEEEGVEVQTVIDALVAAGTERLQELEASLPERVTELVNRVGWGEHAGRGRGHHRGFLGLETAADAIGVTVDELRAALADGSTIAEAAAANDVDVQTVIDALVAEATARLDAAVADGRLDADRAEELNADLVDRITAHVNGEGRGRRGGGPGGASSD